MVNQKPSISIFFPFLNDWGTVGSLVALSIATVSKITNDWEIIIIDDGSKPQDRLALEAIVDLVNSKLKTQNSKLQLKTLNFQKAPKTPRMVARRNSSEVEGSGRIKIIHHGKNRGYGGALRSGFAAVTKDLVFYTDCDAQYDPRELVNLYAAMNKSTVLVNGYKIKRNDPMYRIFAGRLYHHFVKFIFRLPVRDTDCDFRLIKKSVFDRVRLDENTGTICVELVAKINHYYPGKIIEVPVHHFWRTSGKSQFFNFGRLAKTAINLFKLWWKLIILKNY